MNYHPFLVTLHYSFQTKTKVCLVMDVIRCIAAQTSCCRYRRALCINVTLTRDSSGGNLFNVMKEERRLDKKAVRFFAAEMVLALEHLHDCDIVYRHVLLTCCDAAASGNTAGSEYPRLSKLIAFAGT